MRLLVALFFVLPLVMSCASKSTYTANLDMATSRLVSNSQFNIAANMTAEVVYVKDLVTQSAFYRFDASDRHRMAIEQYVLLLPLGRYQIVSICAEKTFPKRLAGLKAVQRKSNGQWWAQFQGHTGTDIFLPASAIEVAVNGGENITPVNLSATGSNHCEVTYANEDLNVFPKSFESSAEFEKKYRKKMTLYK